MLTRAPHELGCEFWDTDSLFVIVGISNCETGEDSKVDAAS